MKILAVIPARAGSKGIPNKNIRIVGAHPLIYYALNNAIQSKYITDVVVTTDSEAVAIIARQMGVECRRRKAELCGDDVTLDAVIYDAVSKDEKWDYIITMQPTSPNLSVKTLDSAIEYAIEQDLDTLISAINAPHLSWSEKDGKKIPNYEKRLNRQYLPACYMETGAFFIFRKEIFTELGQRIGNKPYIYEIVQFEAVDIDTAEDFEFAKAVAAYLDKK